MRLRVRRPPPTTRMYTAHRQTDKYTSSLNKNECVSSVSWPRYSLPRFHCLAAFSFPLTLLSLSLSLFLVCKTVTFSRRESMWKQNETNKTVRASQFYDQLPSARPETLAAAEIWINLFFFFFFFFLYWYLYLCAVILIFILLCLSFAGRGRYDDAISPLQKLARGANNYTAPL